MKNWWWLGACVIGGVAAADEPPAGMAKTVQDLAAQAKPAIVVVTFDGRDGDRQGLGAGFIVHPDGLIATNLHVLGEARPIRVQLHDGRKFDVVAIEASERHHDLALLRIDAKGLPALPLGNSDELQEGQAVVAIGNPVGLERSVVAGVLSGRREVDGRQMLQIALPIERGNSGGPLLDLQGRVHGIVTLKSLKTENLGFAAPVNQLKPLLEQPNPVLMEKWLTIGVVDPAEWVVLPGGRWRQRAGRLQVDGRGGGFGGRCLCLAAETPPAAPFEVGVSVKFEPADGAAGLVFHADGGDRHYGFYPSNGELRLSRFDGPDVYAWTVLKQVKSSKLQKDGWNALKVRVEADKILCYLNDELVIESNDAVYRSGKVGVCKFRQTDAQFKLFRVGTSLPASEPTPDVIARIQTTTTDLPADRPAPVATVQAVLKDGSPALQVLEREARQLEQRASRLRQLAAAVHDQSVREQFAKVIAGPDEQIDLIRAALVIAAADNPELDIEAYVREVERIARRIRGRLPEKADDRQKIAALKQDLFDEHGFHGSRHDYDNRSNSYLNEVLDDREGLPITLSVLFMELARHLEVPIVGIGLPGHFVVRHQPPEGPGALIDPFERGKELTVDEAKAKVAQTTEVGWNDRFLEPMGRRAILVRMLRNLFSEARNAEDPERMLRYTELVLLLQPDSATDRFYRAVLYLQTQRLEQARADADWLQEHQPEGVSRQAIEDLARTIAREAAGGS